MTVSSPRLPASQSTPATLPISRYVSAWRAPACGTVVVVGASTGGTEALKTLLCQLPVSMPPIVVVQHMPEMFTRSFANRLDTLAALRVVKEAEQGDVLKAGTVYIAPGHSHVLITASGGGLSYV